MKRPVYFDSQTMDFVVVHDELLSDAEAVADIGVLGIAVVVGVAFRGLLDRTDSVD